MLRSSKFRFIRISLLLAILSVIVLNLWLSKVSTQTWNSSVSVALYPINADQRTDTQGYIDALDIVHFEPISRFMQKQAEQYGIALSPVVSIQLAPPLTSLPPKINSNANVLQSVIWSLKMRWWSWQNDNWSEYPPDVRIYLQYYSPNNYQQLGHSLGLQKGMIGLVNGFAGIDYIGRNNVVITHELMHALGASDKYNLITGEPDYPEGYADSEQQPLLPQTRAEIMGGRVKVSHGWLLMPRSLDDVMVGTATAREIGWY